MIVSLHARNRIAERFPGMDVQGELAAAVPFGMQFGGSRMLLAPCDAVFVVANDTVVTVLTKIQAQANLARYMRYPPPVDVSQPRSESFCVERRREVAEAKKLEAKLEPERIKDRIESMAKSHWESDPMALFHQEKYLPLVQAEVERLGGSFGKKRKSHYLGRLMYLTNLPRGASS